MVFLVQTGLYVTVCPPQLKKETLPSFSSTKRTVDFVLSHLHWKHTLKQSFNLSMKRKNNYSKQILFLCTYGHVSVVFQMDVKKCGFLRANMILLWGNQVQFCSWQCCIHLLLCFCAPFQTMVALRQWNIRPSTQVIALNHPMCTQAPKQWWVLQNYSHISCSYSADRVMRHLNF